MQVAVNPDQVKQITQSLTDISQHLQQLAAKKEAIPSWVVGLGGSILGFLFALLSDPIKQRLVRSIDRKKIYGSLADVDSVASTLSSLLKTINDPILAPEDPADKAEVSETWEGLKRRHMELLPELSLELFTYYHEVARDRFYALREWSMLVHVFVQGAAMRNAPTWLEAATIATDLRNDIKGALERDELSANIFRWSKLDADARVRNRLAWLHKEQEKNNPAPKQANKEGPHH